MQTADRGQYVISQGRRISLDPAAIPILHYMYHVFITAKKVRFNEDYN